MAWSGRSNIAVPSVMKGSNKQGKLEPAIKVSIFESALFEFVMIDPLARLMASIKRHNAAHVKTKR